MWLSKRHLFISLSIFVSDTINICRLLPTYFTYDSNLLLIKFMLIWPIRTLYWFSFLRCLSSWMWEVFFSFIGWDRRFSDFVNTLWLILSDKSKGKKPLFRCSTDLQNFQIWFRKCRVSLGIYVSHPLVLAPAPGIGPDSFPQFVLDGTSPN